MKAAWPCASHQIKTGAFHVGSDVRALQPADRSTHACSSKRCTSQPCSDRPRTAAGHTSTHIHTTTFTCTTQVMHDSLQLMCMQELSKYSGARCAEYVPSHALDKAGLAAAYPPELLGVY